MPLEFFGGHIGDTDGCDLLALGHPGGLGGFTLRQLTVGAVSRLQVIALSFAIKFLQQFARALDRPRANPHRVIFERLIIGLPGIADDPGFVDVFVRQADVGNSGKIPFWKFALVPARFGNLATLLRGVVFVGEPPNDSGFVLIAIPLSNATRFRPLVVV
ncbi:hypothetical protein [Rhizobium giardinii]|uniref:hypothetical protein n=1 Tax=Rhizobium giardinii TaxID=56731 RepID=UPI003D6EE05A